MSTMTKTEKPTETYTTWACDHGYHGGCRGPVCDCNCHAHDGKQPPFTSEQTEKADA